MRIDQVSMPDVQGKTLQQAFIALYDHCFETAKQVMRINNEIEDLKEEVAELERNQR